MLSIWTRSKFYGLVMGFTVQSVGPCKPVIWVNTLCSCSSLFAGYGSIMNTHVYTGIGYVEHIDDEQILPAIQRRNFKPVHISGNPVIVTFDLETTGLS